MLSSIRDLKEACFDALQCLDQHLSAVISREFAPLVECTACTDYYLICFIARVSDTKRLQCIWRHLLTYPSHRVLLMQLVKFFAKLIIE